MQNKTNNARIPFHDLPADKLIEKLAIVQHKTTVDEYEAALYLNITLNAIRALRYKGKITYYHYGDRVQFEMSDLVEYKKKCKVTAFAPNISRGPALVG